MLEIGRDVEAKNASQQRMSIPHKNSGFGGGHNIDLVQLVNHKQCGAWWQASDIPVLPLGRAPIAVRSPLLCSGNEKITAFWSMRKATRLRTNVWRKRLFHVFIEETIRWDLNLLYHGFCTHLSWCNPSGWSGIDLVWPIVIEQCWLRTRTVDMDVSVTCFQLIMTYVGKTSTWGHTSSWNFHARKSTPCWTFAEM